MARNELSNRERMFVREYLLYMNASQAGIRAGYSPNSIGRNICRVLRRPRVRAALEAAMAERERDLQIDAREVLREIARLGFANMLDYVSVKEDGSAEVDLTGVTRDRAAAIAEITVSEGAETTGRVARGGRRVRLKLANKARSLHMLGRHLGLFPRGAERPVEAGGRGNVEMSDMELAQRILGILVSAGQDRTSPPSPTPPPYKGEGLFAGDETPG